MTSGQRRKQPHCRKQNSNTVHAGMFRHVFWKQKKENPERTVQCTADSPFRVLSVLLQAEVIKLLVELYDRAVVAAAVLLYIRMKRHKPLISLPLAPPLPPDTRALQRLEELRQQQLWQQGRVKEYYTELTDSVRVYLEEAYNIQSTEMTSDQTLDAFHGCKGYSADNASLLSQILQAADMVKFAKSMPQPYQHDMALNQGISFIKQTSALNPQPEPTSESEGDPATSNNPES